LPDDIPRAYVNFLLVEPSGMDVTIAMGHQVGPSAPHWSVRVTMPWEEATFLVSTLQSHIERYSEQFGEVRDVIKRAQETLEGGSSERDD
jgi:hypothetical protein